MSASPREHKYDERLVGGALVRITELVWPDQRRSYQVHLPDSEVDLTEDGCFDDPPTDEQITVLLAEHGATSATAIADDAVVRPDLVRDLLSEATCRVGWEIDLDQLPVTCAHTPHLVVALIDTAAAHLAALAAHTALTEAAESIQTVITNSDGGRVDWFAAGLLGTVAQLGDKRVPQLGHTRRALVAALRGLQEEDAAWPHQPDRTQVPGTHTVIYPGLRECLATLGLHRISTADPAAVVYAADLDEQRITVTIRPDDGYRTRLDVVGHEPTPWSVTFSADTPNALIVAAVRHAIGAPTPPLTPNP